MSTFAITGVAGFIGSHLVDALLRAGHSIVGVDNFDTFYDPQVKRRNLRHALQSPKFTLIEGDIRNPLVAARLYQGEPEAVIHLAARAGVRPSLEQPVLYHDVNVLGTLSLLEEARRHPSCKFVFGSSSSVYGNSAKVPFSEFDPAQEPISPYAASKRAGELICHTYHHLYGIPITCLRFFTVYGPRQRPDLAIHKFARLIDAGKPVPVFGNGLMRRDFTYVDDIIFGITQAMDRCAGFKVYNLGHSQPIAIKELVALLERALGKAARIEYRPIPPGDVMQTYADISLAKRDLGFSPRTDMEIGLARFVEWFRSGGLKAG